ncbi:1-acyl-sn-glycerol-3-phosphate acyltransferase [Desulfosarcina ovata]|nr:1-acyl-sn-glycerol-3-phosphate acyltransferase [Desulfosarcina ovata]
MKPVSMLKRLFLRMTGPAEKRFTCWLPERIGFFTMFILRRLFSGVTMAPDIRTTVDGLPDDAVIVYVSKNRSYFEFLCYYTRYMQARIPFPQLCFDCKIRMLQPIGRLIHIAGAQIRHFLRHFSMRDPYREGFIREEIARGTTAYLPLVGKREFYLSFIKSKDDPIRHLIKIQRDLKRPICLISHLMFFSKRPASTWPTLSDIVFGSPQKPGKLRRLTTLFNKPERIFIEVSDPVNVKAFLEAADNRGRSTAYLALKLRRDLLSQINAHRKSITGPTIKMPEEIKQEILTSEELRQFMTSHAKRRETTIFEAHREAVQYVDEIAAHYSPSFINIAHRIIGRFLKVVFESVTANPDALADIKRVSRKGPVIFMPAHKSHMDSILLSFTLYDNHMPCPHIFAGKNLSFWPMAPIFRRVGAFFVRRSFKGAVFYAKVFSAYIFQLLKEGFNIAVYIEGTRSRSGKLLQPQLGMLSILLHAFFKGACQNLIFVPVFIAYDRIPDEGSYLHEISGGKKSPENFRQMLKAKSILKKRYGSVYLNFGHPLALADVLAEQNLIGASLSSKQQNGLCRSIGAHIMNAIDRQTVVTPQSMVAGALLSSGREIISRKELDFRVEASMSLLYAQKTPLAETLTQGHEGALETTLKHYQGRKFIQGSDEQGKGGGRPDAWRIIENRRNALDYYKNISICHFIPAAFTSLAILEKDAFQFSTTDLHDTYRRLQELFSEEFNPDPTNPPAFTVRKTMKAFIDMAILVPHPTMPDTYNLSSEGYRKLVFFAGYIEPFIAAYQTALVYLTKNRRNRHDRNKMLKRMLGIGNRMLKQGEIRLKESISKANYDNAANFFAKNGIRGSEDEETIRGWNKTLAHYQSLIAR